MAGYRYAPQWDQHARRDTDLVDPVVTVRPLSRFEFIGRTPEHQVDYALVFTGAHGGYEVFIPPRRPTRGELSGGRFLSVHEVDMGIHHFKREFPLPSDNDAFTFLGELDVSWRVVAPDRTVASQVRDVPAHVTPRLEERLRVITRRFAIEDSAGAETAVRDNLTRAQLAEDLGLHMTYGVRLTLDEAARNHQAALRDLAYQSQLAPREIDLERLRETGRQELEELKQRHRHQIERADLAHEQEMLAEKARYYAWYLEQRGVVPWALELAQRPHDLPQIRQLMSKEQEARIAQQLDLLDRVEQSGHWESHQLAEPVRETLRAIRELFAAPDAAPPAVPPSLPPGGGDGPAGAAQESASDAP
ncbi:PE-PGRS family protein [Streptomyces litchfieldiae]|uniref:PE-PGRS family protein n=1 Tax=Streptomyces litchfieldiae TaxID=3075543 RepID=A0ABU2MLL8_9ACTN|nr:PE-PGRS family protein [Streptomyces sp. DSM 44938]MDT0342014.1 PE-PGRS family protein [Streptomyces sp. DSM 44938]